MCDQDPWGMARIGIEQVLFLVAVLLFALITSLVHCSTTSKQHPNNLGTVSYTESPLMYNVGSILDVANIDGNLNVRFSPLGTYSLYDEEILLCGFPSGMFEGVKEPFVLTYKRQASRIVNGVGCHELVRVDNVTTNKRFK